MWNSAAFSWCGSVDACVRTQQNNQRGLCSKCVNSHLMVGHLRGISRAYKRTNDRTIDGAIILIKCFGLCDRLFHTNAHRDVPHKRNQMPNVLVE